MIEMQKSISLKILLSPKNKLLISNTYDKTLMEKIRLMDTLDETEKKSLFNIIDSLVAKKKLKDNLVSLAAQ